MNQKYYLVNNYTMKCRLYLNKAQSKCIDEILIGVKVAYNCALYDMIHNHNCVKDYITEKGETLHYADTKALAQANYLNKLREMNPMIKRVPAGALSGNNGIFLNDMVKALSHKIEYYQDGNGDIKKRHSKIARMKGTTYNPYSLEEAEPIYYNKKKQRKSYTYQASLKNVAEKEDNKNVLYVKLCNIGIKKTDGKITNTDIKIRGWNQKIRLKNNNDEMVDFKDFVKQYNKNITITVSKNQLNQYWICFKLANVYLPMKNPENNQEIGIDVGVKDIVTQSDGTKYKNMYFKKKNKRKIKLLNRKMSRRQGWENPEFREEYTKNHDIKPSKRYLETVRRYTRLHNKIANKRNNYNNEVTHHIVQCVGDQGLIATETLNITGMFRNRHLANALSDACMGSVLEQLRYKSDWYNRDVVAINKWTPSSKKCNNCGYIYKDLKLSTREWTCPNCGQHHDRDINAAINILNEGLEVHIKKNCVK